MKLKYFEKLLFHFKFGGKVFDRESLSTLQSLIKRLSRIYSSWIVADLSLWNVLQVCILFMLWKTYYNTLFSGDKGEILDRRSERMTSGKYFLDVTLFIVLENFYVSSLQITFVIKCVSLKISVLLRVQYLQIIVFFWKHCALKNWILVNDLESFSLAYSARSEVHNRFINCF